MFNYLTLLHLYMLSTSLSKIRTTIMCNVNSSLPHIYLCYIISVARALTSAYNLGNKSDTVDTGF